MARRFAYRERIIQPTPRERLGDIYQLSHLLIRRNVSINMQSPPNPTPLKCLGHSQHSLQPPPKTHLPRIPRQHPILPPPLLPMHNLPPPYLPRPRETKTLKCPQPPLHLSPRQRTHVSPSPHPSRPRSSSPLPLCATRVKIRTLRS
jgi:hypothetical protein